MKKLDEINLLLTEASKEAKENLLDAMYLEMLDTLHQKHEMEMYAAYSYDMDAAAYATMH